ncbi:uncharacterized protein LOC104454346 [Eucalyptus grandis]|uniref:uncharacterized protein LOC104454346 n=1 Tax=Eucalyptus grandis TaxID=71139 RepID=UPI000527F0A8|nr:uncharacterized protein LOC104454346 [Eucalyptus grandis]
MTSVRLSTDDNDSFFSPKKNGQHRSNRHLPPPLPSPQQSLRPPLLHRPDHPAMASGTSIHVTALDCLVHVNSLFTLALFLGLAWNPWDPNNTLNQDPRCAAGPAVKRDLITFEVFSFGSFLFSSVVALALKQAIRNTQSSSHHHGGLVCRINQDVLRLGMLVSGVGSVSGSVCLMLALINVVQIKLGTLACGSAHSFAAVVPLLIFVPVGLFVHICIIMYAFTH